jgi:hypothetical protein
MRVSYTFSVDGTLRFSPEFAFNYKNKHYEFIEKSGFISAIRISHQVNDKKDWPTIDYNHPSDIQNIAINTQALDFIICETRKLKEYLSLFGVLAIDINHPEIEWHPENNIEKKELKLHKYQKNLGKIEPQRIPILPSDIMARCIIAAYENPKTQVAIVFFRKGQEGML